MKFKVTKEEVRLLVAEWKDSREVRHDHSRENEGVSMFIDSLPDKIILEGEPIDKQLAEVIDEYCEHCGCSPCADNTMVGQIN